MDVETHMGITFEIWSGRHTWFWFVMDGWSKGAMIGAAANYADAIREARLSIEEMIVAGFARENPIWPIQN